MAFNNNKFGILTNWQRALFLRRPETSDGKTLEYYLVELDGPNNPPISMLKAWVGVVFLATKDDWFYASPTQSSAPARKLGIRTEEYHVHAPVTSTSLLLATDRTPALSLVSCSNHQSETVPSTLYLKSSTSYAIPTQYIP